MIGAVAFVPQAPLVVPALTGGSSPDLDELRAACRSAIADVAHVAAGRRPVLVGAGAANRAFDATTRGDLSAHGVDVELGLGRDAAGPTVLPIALTVGAWLVRDAVGADSGAVAYSVAADQPHLPDDLASAADDVALIVLGDGSACRTLKAPRYLDERAAGYDANVADALRTGNADGLRRTPLADELHAAGAPVWDAVAPLLAGTRWDAELRYDAATFGVGYFVAVWSGQIARG